jgi:hypothetical protein
MAKLIHIQYPGAVYPVMARGRHGQKIFRLPVAVPCRSAFCFLEELKVAPRQRGFQATDVGVPFCLHLFHGTNDLLEGVQSPAPV